MGLVEGALVEDVLVKGLVDALLKNLPMKYFPMNLAYGCFKWKFSILHL